MRVFVSHGSADTWVARQMARCIAECGVGVFVDDHDLESGDDFAKIIFGEIATAQEMVVLFTPFSHRRAWVWMEIGVAQSLGLTISAVMYGITVRELDEEGGGYPLRHLLARDLNQFDRYLEELRRRLARG